LADLDDIGWYCFLFAVGKRSYKFLWLTGIDTLGVTVTFILSLKYGKGGFTRRDVIALVVALSGLVIWYFTKEAAFALYIVILVDFAGSSLTILKAYEDSSSETMTIWVLSGFSGLFAALAVGSLDWVLLSYPIYILLANWAVVIALVLGKNKLHTKI
jgi:hypothetical protein